MKIGFIGTGDISKAVVSGLNRVGYPYDEIIVSERNAAISAQLQRDCARVRISNDNQAIADEADMLFLAVRPQVAAQVLSGLRFRPEQIVVSLIAMLTHEQLRQWTGPDLTVVRANPLPGIGTNEEVTPILPENSEVTALFDAMGQSVVAASVEAYDAMIVSTTFMGLFFGMQQLFVDWLVAKGGDADGARAYVSSVFLNLAKTGVAEKNTGLEDLRHAHSTRGGLNEQLYRVFDEHGGNDAIKAGLDSVYARVRRANPSE